MPAKKKIVKKTVKKSVRKTAKKVEKVPEKVVKKTAPARKPVVAQKGDRISIVLKNLFLFGALFIISVVVAWISNNALVDQLFWILAILTAFVAVAFLIILLIFVFMRQIRK